MPLPFWPPAPPTHQLTVCRRPRVRQLLQLRGVPLRLALVSVQLCRQAGEQVNTVLPHVLVGVAQPPLPLQQRREAQQQEGGDGPGGLVRH